jgi:hypothetical protein
MLSKPSTKKIILYHFLTLGFYFLYWCSRSRTDINRAARQEIIPTTWLLVVPFANYYWMWQYAEALERVTFKRIKGSDTFLIYIIATSFWFIVSPGYSFSTSSTHLATHALIILISIVLGIFVLVQIAGLAFFCSTIQKKINAVTSNQPINPAA